MFYSKIRRIRRGLQFKPSCGQWDLWSLEILISTTNTNMIVVYLNTIKVNETWQHIRPTMEIGKGFLSFNYLYYLNARKLPYYLTMLLQLHPEDQSINLLYNSMESNFHMEKTAFVNFFGKIWKIPCLAQFGPLLVQNLPNKVFPIIIITVNFKSLLHFNFMQTIRKLPCNDFW